MDKTSLLLYIKENFELVKDQLEEVKHKINEHLHKIKAVEHECKLLVSTYDYTTIYTISKVLDVWKLTDAIRTKHLHIRKSIPLTNGGIAGIDSSSKYIRIISPDLKVKSSKYIDIMEEPRMVEKDKNTLIVSYKTKDAIKIIFVDIPTGNIKDNDLVFKGVSHYVIGRKYAVFKMYNIIIYDYDESVRKIDIGKVEIKDMKFNEDNMLYIATESGLRVLNCDTERTIKIAEGSYEYVYPEYNIGKVGNNIVNFVTGKIIETVYKASDFLPIDTENIIKYASGRVIYSKVDLEVNVLPERVIWIDEHVFLFHDHTELVFYKNPKHEILLDTNDDGNDINTICLMYPSRGDKLKLASLLNMPIPRVVEMMIVECIPIDFRQVDAIYSF